MLGACGERVPVDLYFPVVIAGHLLAGALSPAWRDTWFGAMAGAEAATVWSNWRRD